jgi:hypothetical protein
MLCFRHFSRFFGTSIIGLNTLGSLQEPTTFIDPLPRNGCGLLRLGGSADPLSGGLAENIPIHLQPALGECPQRVEQHLGAPNLAGQTAAGCRFKQLRAQT